MKSRRIAILLLSSLFCLFLTPRAAIADIARDFNTGVYLYKKGDFELAAKTFEMILTKFPGDAKTDEVMFWYGESNYNLQKYADALGIYKKLAAEYPKSEFTSKALFSAGYAAMKLELYKDAVAFFEDVSSDPAVSKDILIETRIVVSECLLKMGDDRAAEKALRDLLATPKLPVDRKQEAEFELGKLLIRVGRAAEGKTEFVKVAEKPGPHQAEALMALGDAAYAGNRYRESLEWYEKIFKKVRGVTGAFRSRAIYNGAWSYLGLGEIDKARALFNEVFEERESTPEIRGDAALRLAQIFREKNNSRSSLEMADAAEKIAEESKQPRLRDDVLIFRAETAFLDRKFDVALGHLARVSDKGYRVLRLTGQIFYESGRMNDAANYFERAAVAAPNRNALNLCLFDMAQSHFAARDYDSSVTAVNRIKDPDDELNARLQPFRAEAFHQAGKFKEAARLYEQLADETADTWLSQKYRYFGALTSFKAKHYGTAAKSLDKFFTITSPAGIIGDSISTAAIILQGDVLAIQGKFDDAQVTYLRAIPAARTVGPENLFLAYSHLIDFSIKYGREQLPDHTQAFIDEMKSDTKTYAFIIDRLYEAEQYKHLLKYTDEILIRTPDNDVLYGKAAYYEMMARYKRNEFSAAERSHDALTRWVTAHPSADIAEEANFWRSRFAQARGDRPRAKSAYLSYLDFYPTGKYVSDAQFNIGLMALEDNQPEEAERQFAKLLGTKSQEEIHGDPLLSDAQYNLASVRIAQGRFEEAVAVLEGLRAHPTFKSNPEYLYKIGYAKVTLGRTPEAEAHFRDALTKSKILTVTLDNAIYALFNLLYRAERYEDLENDFKRYSGKISDKALSAKAKYLMGMTLFDAERFQEAVPYFKGVKPPADTEVIIESTIRLADCDYNLKKYKAALERYTKITEEYPLTSWGREALYASGLCKIKLGFPESALTGFERFLQQNPDEPLAKDVAMEAARLYLGRGDADGAEQKLDFLEKRKVEGTYLEESMRMRIKIWQKRGDADKVLTLSKSHRGAYGNNVEISLAGAEAAIKLGRPQDAIDALEGFGQDVDTNTRAFMDFYRAEALNKMGREGAVELYKRLSDFSDTEIRLSSRFRYGIYLNEQKDFSKARQMFASILEDPAGKLMSFHAESLENAFLSAKQAAEPGEVIRLYSKFKTAIVDEQKRMAAAELNLWAHLQLKDNAKTVGAVDEILSMNLAPRRRTEILLVAAQLHETLKNPEKSDAIYSGILKNPGAEADLVQSAESKKVQLAIARGAAGRPILEDYVAEGPKSEWGMKAAEALLAAAVNEKRYSDVIRIVDLMQTKLGSVKPPARYSAAMARQTLSDTSGAIVEFRKVAEADAPDTFLIAWAAYRVAQDDIGRRAPGEAKKYLKTAWKWRANLDAASSLNTYLQLAEILFESSDYDGMQSLASDPTPVGLPSEPHLLKGLGAWWAKDYATAARHLKQVANPSDQIRLLHAESLARGGNVQEAIDVYEKIAEGHGETAGRAQLAAADLFDSVGKTAEGLIGYYKVLAVYESDTVTELAPEALLRISRAYLRTGDAEKSKTALADLMNKYPSSRAAKEAGGR